MTPDFLVLLTKGQTLVEVSLSDGSLIKVPQWNANGARSLDAWVRQQAFGATPSSPRGAGPMKRLNETPVGSPGCARQPRRI